MRSPDLRLVAAAIALLLAAGFVFDAASDVAVGHPRDRMMRPLEAGPVGSVEALSQQARAAMHSCATARCIADELDVYALGLRGLAPQLPPALKSLPAVVAAAARRVRAAKSTGEAVQAVTAAIEEVHKAIRLLKADDADALDVGTRAGASVADTLQTASNRLEKAAGL